MAAQLEDLVCAFVVDFFLLLHFICRAGWYVYRASGGLRHSLKRGLEDSLLSSR